MELNRSTTNNNIVNILRPLVPPFVKQAVAQAFEKYRIFTAKLRLMPDFIIIGAQRCGTTSLYNYLSEHPRVIPAIWKEVHFFDNNFKKGIAWYRSHFPSFIHKYYSKQIDENFITGEASPYYMFHPHTPKRVFETTPQVKLIALLRNPVDRAYSNYYHEKIIMKAETLLFEDAIDKEGERLSGEREKMLSDKDYESFNHQHYAYLSKGIYVDQLKIWRRFFSKEQMLILETERFFNNIQAGFNKVLDFLGLSNWKLKNPRIYNHNTYPKMDPTTKKRLVDYFKPYNKSLYEYLGVNFNWEDA